MRSFKESKHRCPEAAESPPVPGWQHNRDALVPLWLFSDQGFQCRDERYVSTWFRVEHVLRQQQLLRAWGEIYCCCFLTPALGLPKWVQQPNLIQIYPVLLFAVGVTPKKLCIGLYCPVSGWRPKGYTGFSLSRARRGCRRTGPWTALLGAGCKTKPTAKQAKNQTCRTP